MFMMRSLRLNVGRVVFALSTVLIFSGCLQDPLESGSDWQITSEIETRQQELLPGYGLAASFTAGSNVVSRVDGAIDFVSHRARAGGDFMGSGLAVGPLDSPRARWRGRLQVSVAETYVFTSTTSDTALLVIDGTSVIDDSDDTGLRVNESSRYLSAGSHDFEFRTSLAVGNESAAARLEWRSPSVSREVIPTSRFRPPLADPADTFAPVVVSHGPIVLLNTLAVIEINTDETTTLLLDWGLTTGYGNNTSTGHLGGKHDLTITGLVADQTYYYRASATDLSNNTEIVTGSFRTAPAAQSNGGLLGHFSTSYGQAQRVDGSVSFSEHRARGSADFFGTGLDSSPSEQSTAVWSGVLQVPVSRTYQFSVTSDDGAKLTIGGQIVIFDWSDGGVRTNEGEIYLAAGGHAIELRTFNAGYTSNAQATLKWSRFGGALEVISSNYLRPTSAAGDADGPDLLASGTPMVRSTLATVEVLTNEPSRVYVDWGTTTGYGNTATLNSSDLLHIINIAGLSGETTYHYRVRAIDGAGNTTTSGDSTFTTGTEGIPGGWGPPPGTNCLLPDWCANIGDLAGDNCYISYPTICGGCPRPACGGYHGGCYQANNWCRDIGTMILDDCRDPVDRPLCAYCGDNCELGLHMEPPGGSPEEPPPLGLLARFVTDEGELSKIVPNINYPDQRVDAGNFYGSGLSQGEGELGFAEFEGLLFVEKTETITFASDTDDGVTLLIDGHVVISDWTNGDSRVNQRSVSLTAGWHTIQMRTYNGENSPTTRAILSWQSPSIPQAVVIPDENFSPHAFPGDNTPPQILSLGPRLILDNHATIGVITDEITTVTLEWGLTEGYGNSVTIDLLAVDHSIPINGLTPSTTYHYSVSVTDLSGLTTSSSDQTFTTDSVPVAIGTGGLLGTFTTSTGSEVRVDPTVDFPDHPVRSGGDFFYTGLLTGTDVATATWTGMVLLDHREEYFFNVQSRDGLQLLIDSQTVILDWSNGLHWKSAPVDLETGWHTIELRTYVGPTTDSAEAILRWQSEHTPLAVIPQDHLTPASFPGDDQPPVIESLVARYITDSQATIRATTDEVTTVVIEYGVSTAFGNAAFVNRNDVTHTYTLAELTASTLYYYRAIATDMSGNATISETQTFETTAVPIVSGRGLWGRYETTAGVVEELVPQINFGSHPVGTGASDSFGTGLGPARARLSAQWTGLVLADEAESITFTTTTDDGVKLIIDGRVIIGDWTGGGARTLTGTATLTKGWHPIQLHVYNDAGTEHTAAVLEWESASIDPREVVPSDHLREDRPPRILSADPDDITVNSATITVRTDEITSAVIFLGTTPSYGGEMESTTPSTEHVFELTGLADDTEYHYTVRVVDVVGNQTDLGVDRTFRTNANPTDPPLIVCPDHRLYDGASVSGLSPALFTEDSASLCWAVPVNGGTVASFIMDIIPDEGATVRLVDREYQPPRSMLVTPGCANLLWCDALGAQNLKISDTTPEGPATLRYTATSGAGTTTTVDFPLIVMDLRAAIVRLLTALDAYAVAGIVNDAGARSDLTEARLVYTHALDAFDAGHMPTVYASLMDMHGRSLSVRDELSGQSDYMNELEMLMTEVNTAAVLWADSRVKSGSEFPEDAVQDRLTAAWNNRDVKMASSSATHGAYWSLVRHEIFEQPMAMAVESRIAGSEPGRPADAGDLIGLVLDEAEAIDDAIESSDNMLGATEAVDLRASAEALSEQLWHYERGDLGNHDIAEVIHDSFDLLTLIHNADQAHLGVDKLQYLVLLSLYSVVDRVIQNATLNICSGASHPLIVEARRRWNHLSEQLELYESTGDEEYLAEFARLVLGPHGTWNQEGPLGANPVAAYPRVLCFIAEVYDSAYTADADALFYSHERLVIPGCDETEPDWISGCGL